MTRQEYITRHSGLLRIDCDQYEREMPYSYVIYNVIHNTCHTSPDGYTYVYGSYDEAAEDCIPNVGDVIIREDYYVKHYLK